MSLYLLHQEEHRVKRDGYWGGTIPWISAKDIEKTENIDTSDLFITKKGLKAGSKIAPKEASYFLHEKRSFNGIPIARVEKMWLSIKI